MTKTEVFIATTEGPSRVLSIRKEGIGTWSAMCVSGSSATLPVSSAYEEFISIRSGFVAKKTGHESYLTDLSAPITTGLSFGLGMLIAHALNEKGALSHSGEASDKAIWASGELRRLSGGNAHELPIEVTSVRAVLRKLEASEALFASFAEQGIPVEIHIPQVDLEADVESAIEQLPGRVRLVPHGKTHLHALWELFGSDGAPSKRLPRAVGISVVAGSVAALSVMASVTLNKSPRPVGQETGWAVPVKVIPSEAGVLLATQIAGVETGECIYGRDPTPLRREAFTTEFKPLSGLAQICGGGFLRLVNQTDRSVTASVEVLPERNILKGPHGPLLLRLEPGDTGTLRWPRKLDAGKGLSVALTDLSGRTEVVTLVAPSDGAIDR